MRKKVLVLGGNFGGLTAALSVKQALDGDVDVTVVSASDRFLFNPSLIWLPSTTVSPAGRLRRALGSRYPSAPSTAGGDAAPPRSARSLCLRAWSSSVGMWKDAA